MSNQDTSYVFFGTPQFAADILAALIKANIAPSLVVTAPDRPSGRGQKTSPPPVATLAAKHGIPVLQPEEINKSLIQKLDELSPKKGWDLFVVIAYGHILPKELIYLPTRNTLNVHPSLLPKLRGPAPIRSAILDEDNTGVSIIELDEKMDHGPIVAQKELHTEDWPPYYADLLTALTDLSSHLLIETIPQWVSGGISAEPQKHEQATYSRKFNSDDGEIDLTDDPETNLRKIHAFTNWPKAYIKQDGDRILITKAHLEKGELIIDRVKPAGKNEIAYQEFTSQ